MTAPTTVSSTASANTAPTKAGAVYAAVDIGASSGRVIIGRIRDADAGHPGRARSVELEVVHRFPNGVVEIDGGLRWDFDALFAEVLKGLSAAATVAAVQDETIASIGIDTWAVDYGLVNAAGELTAQPYSYRDDRSRAAVAPVHRQLDPARLYGTTGLQFLQFNTLYQLATEPDLDGVQALLIPDLIAYFLTGQRRTEATNASTTGLFDAVGGEWATEFLTALGLRKDLFPPLVQPGETVGTLLPEIASQVGLPAGTKVVAVGSHDTASAVAAVPAAAAGEGEENFAYISSGTWSLVGLELQHPVLTEASRAANFTNERGVDGTVRYLRNMGGLGCSANASEPGPRKDSLRTSRRCSLPPRHCRRAGPKSIRTIPTSSPRTTCPNASAQRSAASGTSCPMTPRPSPAASWTAWPTATPAPSATPNASPTVPWMWSTWWAAGRRTGCCASSRPMPRASGSSPDPWKPPPSATSWSRPGPPGRSAAGSRNCAAWWSVRTSCRPSPRSSRGSRSGQLLLARTCSCGPPGSGHNCTFERASGLKCTSAQGGGAAAGNRLPKPLFSCDLFP